MNEQARVRRRLRVTGHVQGVFFRDSCRQEAERLGVAGEGRNLPDGSVEVVAAGPGDAVEALVDWSRRGSSKARVDDVRVDEEEPQGLTGFSTA